MASLVKSWKDGQRQLPRRCYHLQLSTRDLLSDGSENKEGKNKQEMKIKGTIDKTITKICFTPF